MNEPVFSVSLLEPHFRVAFAVLTPEGRKPRPCELELVSRWSQQLPEWWAIATRGTSTLEVSLP